MLLFIPVFGCGLDPNLLLLLIISNSSKSAANGLGATEFCRFCVLKSLKAEAAGVLLLPVPLKPLLWLTNPGTFDWGISKPMFRGDWAVNPIFWVKVGLLNAGDEEPRVTPSPPDDGDHGSTVRGVTIAGEDTGALQGSTAAAGETEIEKILNLNWILWNKKKKMIVKLFIRYNFCVFSDLFLIFFVFAFVYLKLILFFFYR